MGFADRLGKHLAGLAGEAVHITPVTLTADDSEGASNRIGAGVRSVVVGGVTNDADDFIVMPPVGSVELGHQVVVMGNAGSDFEIRTPALSGETINGLDCDGTKEYLATDTQVIFLTKNITTGWIGQGFTALGEDVAEVVPD